MTGIFHIVVARKPIEGTIVENCLQWETGALWIDGTRVASVGPHGSRGRRKFDGFNEGKEGKFLAGPLHSSKSPENTAGRWPANLVLEDNEEILKVFPEAGNGWTRNYGEEDYQGRQYDGGSFGGGGYIGGSTYCDSGTAARFFFNYTEQESDE
jgi:site-specific DNA-methyltransferase (adenine-specific)